MSTTHRFAAFAVTSAFAFLHATVTFAQQATPEEPKKEEKKHEDRKEEKTEKKKEEEKHWYEKLSLRGYTQIRFTPYTSNDLLKIPSDKSVGEDAGVLIRRARLVLQGEAASFLSIYLQPDFASILGDTVYVAQLRDWYGDIFFDKKKELRLRVGQSKVPYGFENMQSSSNRVPFDRTDAINTGTPDERDLGAFFYYAPEAVRKQFKHLVDAGLKGSGDYGMAAFGVYNGQGMNRLDRNDNLHFVTRLTYPFAIGNQILEIGAGAYAGMYRITKGEGIAGPDDVRDMRTYGQIVLYPQPIGFQAEYNIGRGPELEGKTIKEKALDGGYVMAMAKIGPVIPYVRATHYEGGRKSDTNAPRQVLKELEAGAEWQIHKALELTCAFAATTRKVDGKEQEGKLIRLQLQLNY
jgi:hypothetical protein